MSPIGLMLGRENWSDNLVLQAAAERMTFQSATDELTDAQLHAFEAVWREYTLSLATMSEAQLSTERQKRSDPSFYELWRENIGNFFASKDSDGDSRMSKIEAGSFLSSANNLDPDTQWNLLILLGTDSDGQDSFELEDFLKMDEILLVWDEAGKKHALNASCSSLFL